MPLVPGKHVQSCVPCLVLCGYISAIYPSSQQVVNYIIISTPNMLSDKDMNILLLWVSNTGVVDIVTLWLELLKGIHCGYHLPKENLYSTYKLIPLWLGCAMHPNGCFLCAISSWGTVSSFNSMRNTISNLEMNTTYPTIVAQSLSAYYRGLCWTGALCILYKLLGIGHLYKHSSSVSHVNEARKRLFVSAIDRYATLYHTSSLIPSCRVCSKQRWSCTLGSTMVTDPLRWGRPV